MTETPKTLKIGGAGDELLFGQVFHRPEEGDLRPAIGVYLWEVDDGEFQVSVGIAGTEHGGAVFPAGLQHRMSAVMTLADAKVLMRQWLGEVGAAVQAEWGDAA